MASSHSRTRSGAHTISGSWRCPFKIGTSRARKSIYMSSRFHNVAFLRVPSHAVGSESPSHSHLLCPTYSLHENENRLPHERQQLHTSRHYKSRPETSTPPHLPFKSKRHRDPGLKADMLTSRSVKGRPYCTLGHTISLTEFPLHVYGLQQGAASSRSERGVHSKLNATQSVWRFLRDAAAYAVAGSAIRRARVEKRIID